MRAVILFIEGTNCEEEGWRAFQRAGFDAEKVHLKQLIGDCSHERRRRLGDFDVLFIPGGWSAGDYVRAGAIFASRLKARLGSQLTEFVDKGKSVIGVCNGFQVLVESGLLPGFDGMSEHPEAVMAINANARFQCRPAYVRHSGGCAMTSGIPEGEVMQLPVAHAEGRLSFAERDAEMLKRLKAGRQIVFTYCLPDGRPAAGVFPWNPNGSLADIAGICNPKGNVLGMMPHPERVIDPIQHADWTRREYSEGDGLKFFRSIAQAARR